MSRSRNVRLAGDAERATRELAFEPRARTLEQRQYHHEREKKTAV